MTISDTSTFHSGASKASSFKLQPYNSKHVFPEKKKLKMGVVDPQCEIKSNQFYG